MPLPPDELFAHVRAAADDEGRLPLSAMTAWDVFPFERVGLRSVVVEPPSLPEPPRAGEGGRPCPVCTSTAAPLWSDEQWRLGLLDSGAPLLLVLGSRAHVDLADLDDERAGELGRLVVHLVRAVEGLEHIARAHVSRWGDGGAHLHVLVYARPAGFPQFRGTCFGIWEELLPPPPTDVRDADVAQVVAALRASYGGT